MLATCVGEDPEDWEEYVSKACMAYNTSVNATTGYTPFYLMFGRQARIPVDLMYGTAEPESASYGEYTTKLQQSLSKAYTLARESLARQAELYIQSENTWYATWGWGIGIVTKLSGAQREIQEISPVVDRTVKVVKGLSKEMYRIQHVKNRAKQLVVHFDRLKRCRPDVRLSGQLEAPTNLKWVNIQPVWNHSKKRIWCTAGGGGGYWSYGHPQRGTAHPFSQQGSSLLWTLIATEIPHKIQTPTWFLQHVNTGVFQREGHRCSRRSGNSSSRRTNKFISIQPPSKGPHQPKKYKFPEQQFGNKGETRSFKVAWFDSWPGIDYQEVSDSITCYYCSRASTQKLLTKGFYGKTEETFLTFDSFVKNYLFWVWITWS